MKLFTMLGLAAALTSGGDLTTNNPSASKPPATTSTAAAATAPAAELPVIDGIVLNRADGTFLQVKMEENNFVLRFFNKEHKQIAPDVDRATVRLTPASRKPERYVLARGSDGQSLTHGKPIRAPHVFKVDISLFKGDSESAVESFATNYP